MWRPWAKSKVKLSDKCSSSSPSFICSSFKDIQQLCTEEHASAFPSSSSSPRTTTRVFHRVRFSNAFLRTWSAQQQPPDGKPAPPISIPGSEDRIVVYYTSLRVVRPTFEDCKAVRSILRGFRVRVDERDLSMDASFAAELRRILGQSDPKMLPRVFVGGRYVGGAEEVRQLHESGELKKMVQSLPAVEPRECETCGGFHFVPCNLCHGSHKVYREKLGFKTCSHCNENGLIKCPSCSSGPL